ncbi:hypothetical protein SEVIR_9G007750v4 [Setaria viridis]|uniref:Uncharacterized protein n=1 Tax=Setaria viridis TaxID=4556 RepID=A0A4U6SSU6_SETVI|nr:hypothetical protein SEVIR_9G007750v2 [Setaria viridis]
MAQHSIDIELLSLASSTIPPDAPTTPTPLRSELATPPGACVADPPAWMLEVTRPPEACTHTWSLRSERCSCGTRMWQPDDVGGYCARRELEQEAWSGAGGISSSTLHRALSSPPYVSIEATMAILCFEARRMRRWGRAEGDQRERDGGGSEEMWREWKREKEWKDRLTHGPTHWVHVISTVSTPRRHFKSMSACHAGSLSQVVKIWDLYSMISKFRDLSVCLGTWMTHALTGDTRASCYGVLEL